MKKHFFKSFIENIYLFLMFLFLYFPIVILMIFSFNSIKSTSNWGGFSTRWYVQMFSDDALLGAFGTTITIAIIAALASCVIGTAAAIGIQGFRSKRLKGLINAVTNLPMVSSELVMGVSMMMLFLTVKIPLGYFTLLLAHITFCVPYVIVSVLPKLVQLDAGLYEAALDLGAKPFYAFRKVVLPEIKPGIISGMLIAFTLSIDDFVISFFTTGNGVNNLSIYIYSSVRRGVNPMYNALSTVMFILVAILLFIINKRSSSKTGDSPIGVLG
ncbi:MAG: ABC transporter permease [Clostridia bacterium]|nr:ABC transporter permease [Clostridia bacterium]